jgi:hypothetical protein
MGILELDLPRQRLCSQDDLAPSCRSNVKQQESANQEKSHRGGVQPIAWAIPPPLHCRRHDMPTMRQPSAADRTASMSARRSALSKAALTVD